MTTDVEYDCRREREREREGGGGERERGGRGSVNHNRGKIKSMYAESVTTCKLRVIQFTCTCTMNEDRASITVSKYKCDKIPCKGYIAVPCLFGRGLLFSPISPLSPHHSASVDQTALWGTQTVRPRVELFQRSGETP